jgi:hypothetical protein
MSILANATLWPLLLLLSSLSAVTIGVSAFCVLFRITTAWDQQSKLTQSQRHLKYWWMPPVKDLLDASVWASAFSGNEIIWRGERYRIDRSGKLSKL